MPKPRTLRRQRRRLALELARRHFATVLAAVPALLEESPPPELPTTEVVDYRGELQRLHDRAVYWERRGGPRRM